jgi:hypothetical protein
MKENKLLKYTSGNCKVTNKHIIIYNKLEYIKKKIIKKLFNNIGGANPPKKQIIKSQIEHFDESRRALNTKVDLILKDLNSTQEEQNELIRSIRTEFDKNNVPPNAITELLTADTELVSGFREFNNIISKLGDRLDTGAGENNEGGKQLIEELVAIQQGLFKLQIKIIFNKLKEIQIECEEKIADPINVTKLFTLIRKKVDAMNNFMDLQKQSLSTDQIKPLDNSGSEPIINVDTNVLEKVIPTSSDRKKSISSVVNKGVQNKPVVKIGGKTGGKTKTNLPNNIEGTNTIANMAVVNPYHRPTFNEGPYNTQRGGSGIINPSSPNIYSTDLILEPKSQKHNILQVPHLVTYTHFYSELYKIFNSSIFISIVGLLSDPDIFNELIKSILVNPKKDCKNFINCFFIKFSDYSTLLEYDIFNIKGKNAEFEKYINRDTYIYMKLINRIDTTNDTTDDTTNDTTDDTINNTTNDTINDTTNDTTVDTINDTTNDTTNDKYILSYTLTQYLYNKTQISNDNSQQLLSTVKSSTEINNLLDILYQNIYILLQLYNNSLITHNILINNYYSKYIYKKKKIITFVKERNNGIRNPRYHIEILNNQSIYLFNKDKTKYTTLMKKNTAQTNKYLLLGYLNIDKQFYSKGQNDDYDINKTYKTLIESTNTFVDTKTEKKILDNKQNRSEYYYLGPFENYYYNTSNADIAHDSASIIFHKLINNNEDICIFTYGASGSGKTSSLIYYERENIDGIIIELCKLPEFIDNFLEISLSIINIYTWHGYDATKSQQEIGNKHYRSYYMTYTDIINNTEILNPTFLWRNNNWKYKNDLSKPNTQDHRSMSVIINDILKKRQTEPTSNNPDSSRSHILICFTLSKKNNSDEKRKIVVCDFAGVENVFDCEDVFELSRFANAYHKSIKYNPKKLDFAPINGKIPYEEKIHYDKTYCNQEKEMDNMIKFYSTNDGSLKYTNLQSEYNIKEQILNTSLSNITDLEGGAFRREPTPTSRILDTKHNTRLVVTGTSVNKNQKSTPLRTRTLPLRTLPLKNQSTKQSNPQPEPQLLKQPKCNTIKYKNIACLGQEFKIIDYRKVPGVLPETKDDPIIKNVSEYITYLTQDMSNPPIGDIDYQNDYTNELIIFKNIIDSDICIIGSSLYENINRQSNLKIIITVLDKSDSLDETKKYLERYMNFMNTLMKKSNNYTLQYDNINSYVYVTRSKWKTLKNSILLDAYKTLNAHQTNFNTTREQILKQYNDHIKRLECNKIKIETLNYNCKLRRNEGYVINKTLFDLQIAIKQIIYKSLEINNSGYFPTFYEKEIFPYCRNTTLDNNKQIDSFYKISKSKTESELVSELDQESQLEQEPELESESELKLESTLTGEIIRILSTIPSDDNNLGFGINLSDVNFVIFTIINTSNDEYTNNPPNPPYININNLIYYTKYSSVKDKHLYIINEIKSLLLELSKYDYYKTHSKIINIRKQFLINPDIITPTNENFYKESEIGSKAGANIEFIYTELLNIISINNNATLIGTIEATDAMQNLVYNMSCSYNSKLNYVPWSLNKVISINNDNEQSTIRKNLPTINMELPMTNIRMIDDINILNEILKSNILTIDSFTRIISSDNSNTTQQVQIEYDNIIKQIKEIKNKAEEANEEAYNKYLQTSVNVLFGNAKK